MYPRERSLMERLRGKPFVILGVNSDPKDKLRQTMKRERMTWRSWWDGGSPFGPIATKWNVTDWPALYLLDHRGVIRHKFVGGSPGDDVIDKSVDALIKVVENISAKY